LESRPWHQHYDYNVPTTIRYPRFPAQNLVHIAAAQFPHKAAVDFYGTELTFVQLRSQMLRLANALGRLGVKKGDRVGIALPNCPQYVIAYHAAMSAGAIVVNINPYYTHDELKFMMENTALETLVTFDEALPTMRSLAKELGLKRVIVTKLTDYIAGKGTSSVKSLDLEEGWHHFSSLIDGCDDMRLPRIAFDPEDTALIQFTGGTTGLPKGAEITHANIIASIFQVSGWFNSLMIYTPYEKRNAVITIPQFHIYGNLCMNWSLQNAATQILLPRFDLGEAFDIMKRFDQITFFPAVPTMITAIVHDPQAEALKIGERLRYFHSGAAPMPTELITKVKDMGISFGEGWGMSETTSVGTGNPQLANKAGSIGIPLIDNEVRLVDVENGLEEVKPGEPGEMLFKGPTVMKGYWNNPEETRNQLTEDDWLHTGDVAQADEDGYLYIVDRKKDMIIAGGFNIYPREVDEVLYQHPKVAEAVTVGVPDAYRGETVKVFIVLKAGETATDAEIIRFCKEKLVPYKVPKQVELRDSLPKSAVGKILRKILREEEMAKKNS
jgi:long-chain acyl-CoA synthetase